MCKLQASPKYTLLAFFRCKDFQEGYKNHGQKKPSSDCISLYVTGAKWGKRGGWEKGRTPSTTTLLSLFLRSKANAEFPLDVTLTQYY